MKDQKISVAMYCPHFLPAYGGAELATFSLAKELTRLCDVKLYTLNWTQDLDANKNYKLNFSCGFPQQEIVSEVPIHRYPVTNLPVVEKFSLKLMKDMKFCGADIIHFQGTIRLFSRLLLQKVVKDKIKILTTHGFQESVEMIRRSRLSASISSLFIYSLKSMDHIIALSNTDVDLLVYFGVNKDNITLIPNGVDVIKFENRRKFVKRNGKMKILCVARFDKNKNYESLVYALSKLKDDVDFEAYFVGSVTDYKYYKKIVSLIDKNGLEKFVNIGLSLDDPAVVDCYLSCDLFVLPSNVETFGMVILEAMYAGLPIIATHVGCVPDIVKDGVNGFVIPKNDPVSLFERCLQLFKNEKMRKDMGAINKEVARNYTWSNIASSTLDLYQQLIKVDAQK
jgi:glycosyltransferase involved in cell wall biosynthesis